MLASTVKLTKWDLMLTIQSIWADVHHFMSILPVAGGLSATVREVT